MLTVRERVDLSGYTTLRLGGPAARFADAGTADDVVAATRDADLAGESLLLLGGGSNLVIADDGFPGTVVRVGTSGVRPGAADGDRVLVTVAAGEQWDRLVEWSVEEKLAGIECLAGIPGLAGATPIQNVGAYGQEVATTIEAVRVFDRARGALATLSAAACGFGYRSSVFKRDAAAHAPTGTYVVLEVTLALRRDPMSDPIRYPELAATLGLATGAHAPLAEVRSAVLDLRRRKGMVLDPADADTASAGSFFTNPVLTPEQFGRLERAARARDAAAVVPSYPAGAGQVKVPAAWLIERAGFAKGYPPGGPARISSKHTLALTNAGGASTAGLLDLAREITAGVRAAFGIQLENEPVLVGVAL